MRIACSPTPLPSGKGFSVSRRPVLAALAAILSVGMLAAPASAANVGVTLTVGLGDPVPGVTVKTCAVSVASGANGIAVLDAAVAGGCILSYEVDDFGFDEFVRCIDHVCGDVGLQTFWSMTENGAFTSYGVGGFVANAGDVLGFAYTRWS